MAVAIVLLMVLGVVVCLTVGAVRVIMARAVVGGFQPLQRFDLLLFAGAKAAGKKGEGGAEGKQTGNFHGKSKARLIPFWFQRASPFLHVG